MRNLKTIGIIFIIISLLMTGCVKKDSEKADGLKKVLNTKVTMVKGKAYLLRENSPAKITLKIGSTILPADIIITGKNSSANIMIAKRGVIKIKENSSVSLRELVEVDDTDNITRIKVAVGKVVVGLLKLKKDSIFEIETPTAVAGVRGTTFSVTVENDSKNAFPHFVKTEKVQNSKTKIAVLTGSVELVNNKNKEESIIIDSLKEATLSNDDFKNVKVDNIKKEEVAEFSAIKEFSEIKDLKIDEVIEEIGEGQEKADDMIKAELKAKAKVKIRKEDITKTEDKVDSDAVEAEKNEVIDKDKQTDNDDSSKYLDKGETWD